MDRKIITSTTMEALQDSPARTKVSMNKALSNISMLLADLDDIESDHGEMKRVHDKVDALLEQTADQQSELSEDLSALYAALRKGHMTPAQLETLVTSEQEKSLFILNLSTSVNRHLHELYQHIQEMAAQAQNGTPVSGEYLHSLGQQVEMVNLQLATVTKAASSPPKKFKTDPSIFSTLQTDHEAGMKKLKQDFEEIARKVAAPRSRPGSHHAPVSHAAKRRPLSATPSSSSDSQPHAQVVMVDKQCQVYLDREHDSDVEGRSRLNSPREYGSHSRSDHQDHHSSHSSSAPSHAKKAGGLHRDFSNSRENRMAGHEHARSATHSPHTIDEHSSSNIVHGSDSRTHSLPLPQYGHDMHDADLHGMVGSAHGSHPISRPLSGLPRTPSGAQSPAPDKHKEFNIGNAIIGQLQHLQQTDSPVEIHENSKPPSVAGSRRASMELSPEKSMHSKHEEEKRAAKGYHGSGPEAVPSYLKGRRGSREAIPSPEELALRAKEAEKLRHAKFTISSQEKKIKELEKQLREQQENFARESEALQNRITECQAHACLDVDGASKVGPDSSAVGSISAVSATVMDQMGVVQPMPSQASGNDSRIVPSHANSQQYNQAQHDRFPHPEDMPMNASFSSSLYSKVEDEYDLGSHASDGTVSIGCKAGKLLRIATSHAGNRVPLQKDAECVVVGDSFKSLESLQHPGYIANNSQSVVSKSGSPRMIDSTGMVGVRYDEASDGGSGSIRLHSPGASITVNDIGDAYDSLSPDMVDHIIIPSILLAQDSASSGRGGSTMRAQSAGGQRTRIDNAGSQGFRPGSSRQRQSTQHLSTKRFDKNAKGVLSSHLAADRELAALRNKDAKWDEAKSFLKGLAVDKVVGTEDLAAFCQEGADSSMFAGALTIAPRTIARARSLRQPMDDNIESRAASPRPISGNKTETSKGTGSGPEIPYSTAADYKPSADVTSLTPNVTRLGVVPVTVSFDSELQTSDHPLYLLFKKFKPYLAENARSSLMRATFHELLHAEGIQMRKINDSETSPDIASHEAKLPLYVPKNTKRINEFFAEYLEMIVELHSKANNCATAVQVCERSVAVLISMAHDPNCNPDVYDRCLQATYKKLGSVGSQKLQVSLELAEYRTFFEGINSLAASSFNSMIKQCPDFKKSYDYYIDTQGISVEFSDRFSRLKNLCKLEKLFAKCRDNGLMLIDDKFFGELDPDRAPASVFLEYPISPIVSPSKERIAMSTRPKTADTALHSMHFKGDKALKSTGGGANNGLSDAKRVKQKSSTTPPTTDADNAAVIKGLKQRVEKLEEELDDAKCEVMNLLNSKDLTPGALLFYSTLSDPISIITFKKLHGVLMEIKDFVQSTEHFNFAVMRKKLLECVAAGPQIDRFVCRYTELHRRWSEHRFALFTQRGLQGGNADGFYTCPICHHDSRSQFQHQNQHGGSGESDIHGMFPARNKSAAQRLREGIASARKSSPRPNEGQASNRPPSAPVEKPTLRVPSTTMAEDEVSLHSDVASKTIVLRLADAPK